MKTSAETLAKLQEEIAAAANNGKMEDHCWLAESFRLHGPGLVEDIVTLKAEMKALREVERLVRERKCCGEGDWAAGDGSEMGEALARIAALRKEKDDG